MKARPVTVIVPRLPPAIDGLGDYGLTLARKLRQDFGIDTSFVVSDPNWTGEESLDGFQVEKLSKRDMASLLATLPNDQKATVIVHYVGYGYARRGCPTWLIKGLEQWRQYSTERKLVTMFHELFAFGPIWSSQFWTSPLQRLLVARLGKVSDHCLTSKKIYAEILADYTSGKHADVTVLPVFSNIGEPENLKPLQERKKRIIIFGSKGPRRRVYLDSRSELENICEKFNIDEIFDIGSPLEFEIKSIHGVQVQVLGVRSPEEISKIMADSQVGFINYQTEYLAKSGIFAAFCSHGMLPMAAYYKNQRIDAVEENVHYWISSRRSGEINMESAQKIADNAHHWYKGHALSEHAKAFRNFIEIV